MRHHSQTDTFSRDYLFVFDSNYIYPFFVSLFSLVCNSPNVKRVLIAYDESMLSTQCRSDIVTYCEILNKDLEFLTVILDPNLPVSKGFNTATYAKLFAIAKISNPFVYFDVDTLIVKDVDEMWSSSYFPTNRQAISARTDPGISIAGSKNQAILNSNGRYFNAGVMIVNTSAWKALGFSENLSYAISNYDNLGFEWLDQCIFNYLVAGEYHSLPIGFNFFVGESCITREEISVFHFAGSHKKPWRIPQSFLHRFLYLRLRMMSKPYSEYLKYEKAMLRFLRRRDLALFKSVLAYRKLEFAKAPHLLDLLLFKFEMKKFGSIIKLIHKQFVESRSK